MTEPVDIPALRATAEKATPGPWWREHQPYTIVAAKVNVCGIYDGGRTADSASMEADAAFIERANPSVVLSLLDELERLRTDNERLHDLHERIASVDDVAAAYQQVYFEDFPTVRDALTAQALAMAERDVARAERDAALADLAAVLGENEPMSDLEMQDDPVAMRLGLVPVKPGVKLPGTPQHCHLCALDHIEAQSAELSRVREGLKDLRERIASKVPLLRLSADAADEHGNRNEVIRLMGKANGVELALSFVDELRAELERSDSQGGTDGRS